MQLIFDRAALAPMLREIVAEMVDQFGSMDRVAFPEKEAAAMFGVNQCVLKDARLLGQISGSKIGRSYCYSRKDLIEFMERRRSK